jgi:hypothetical protein
MIIMLHVEKLVINSLLIHDSQLGVTTAEIWQTYDNKMTEENLIKS